MGTNDRGKVGLVNCSCGVVCIMGGAAMKRKTTPHLNEYNPDHFVTPRRLPRFQPDRGLYPDGYVMIVCLVLAVTALAYVYFTEGL